MIYIYVLIGPKQMLGWLATDRQLALCLSPEQIRHAQNAGDRIILSPNCNVQVISATISRKLISLTGVASVSEAGAS